MNSDDQTTDASSHKQTSLDAGKRWQFIVAYVLMAWPWIYLMYIYVWVHESSDSTAGLVHFILAMAVSVGASLFVVRRRSLHVVAWISLIWWCAFIVFMIISAVMQWYCLRDR